MRFDLDHDWQGNMSTPRARVGERAKTHLLLILCAVWLFMGLIGHAPWKPFESHSMSVIKTILDNSEYLTPVAASSNKIINPPLFYLSAAAAAKIFQPILPLHDGARIATGLWMLLTFLMVGMTGRELWGKGTGRQTTFVLMGTLGLIISAHTLTPAVASLTGLAAGFYALALSRRRPYRASVLLGVALGISFLSTGLLPLSILAATCLALPCLFSAWRSKSFMVFIGLSCLVASPFLIVWPVLCLIFQPDIFNTWWLESIAQFGQIYHLYFLNLLLWYAWPALPLAVWGIWRFRAQLLIKPKFQLMITFSIIAFAFIGLGGEHNQIFALPLLIPLTAMAGGSIETLKRGTAGALNWFGLILFGLMSGLIWLGWIAMMSGNPIKVKERLTFLSGLTQLNFNFVAFILALAVSLIWLVAIFRSQHSNRSATTNWAIGLTCVWTLLMTLWLPMIDSARSYSSVFKQFKNVLPESYACVSSNHLGEAQRDLLHYYANVKTQAFETEQNLNCDLYLIQDERGRLQVEPGADWELIWNGKRLNDRRESFRLFKRVT